MKRERPNYSIDNTRGGVDITRDFDTGFLSRINSYYNKDNTIKACCKKLQEYIFKDGWGVLFDSEILGLGEFVLFKSVFMQVHFETFISQLRDQERMFNFCIYYTIPDIREWLIDYKKLSVQCNASSYKYLEQPFGLCAFEEVRITVQRDKKRMQPYLKVTPLDEKKKRRYNYHIIYDQYNFQSISARIYNLNNTNGGGLNNSSSSTNVIEPDSTFEETSKRFNLIQFYSICRDRCHYTKSNMQPIIAPKPKPDIPIEQVSEQNLYLADDIPQAQHNTKERIHRIAFEDQLEMWDQYVATQFKRNATDNFQKDAKTKRSEFKNFFGQYDPMECPFNVPEASDVIIPYTPGTEIDIDRERDNYKYCIYNIFGIPSLIMDTDTNSQFNSSSSSRYRSQSQQGNVDDLSKLFINTIRKEQERMKILFQYLFENTFRKMERLLNNYLVKVASSFTSDSFTIDKKEADGGEGITNIETATTTTKTDIEEDETEELEVYECKNRLFLEFYTKKVPNKAEMELLVDLLKIPTVPVDYVWGKLKEMIDI